MRIRRHAAVIIVPLILTACGGVDSDDSSTSTLATSAGSDGGAQNASSGSDEDTPTVEIVDSGFGQNSTSASAIVIAKSDDDAAVGEFVTATVNFLDADGAIIATEDQVEAFSWAGQQLVLPVSLFDPGAIVASIEPSVSISDYGSTEPVGDPLPTLDATEIQDEGGSGYYTASFGFTNETDSDLESLRFGVVCYDGAGNINGGGSTYPNVAPAGSTIRVDAEGLTTTGTPASCQALVNYGSF